MMAVPLIILAASIVITIWIYKDANRRGDPQAAMWAILGFFFNIVGLVIYLAVRNRNTTVPPAAPPPPPPAV